ncbi:restriction endonuclease subunit S [Acidithiobacillus sp. IBUN Pt1247-S3]|uniref:restriction endonuclease subunit S n=1 Tax=Acidithiobacillus sp. IBUN Pt1247-S3 TaxID=3166642 RepID=UPI0034E4F0F0
MTPLLDVRADHLKIVQDILHKFVPEREVWAFGSRAKWLAKEYSDLDLCVVGDTPLGFRTLGLLEEAFEDSDLPYKVDVVDWATTSESFRKIIERDRVVVQKAGRGWVMIFNPPEIYLAEIVTIKGGKRLPAGKNLQSTPSKHPYIRVRDVGQRTLPREGIEYVPDDVFPLISRYIVQENDVVLSIVGTIGALSIVDKFYDYASLTENCVRLTGLDYHDALYLYYYLSSRLGQQEIAQGTVGAVQPKLPIYNIEKIKVLWPKDKEKRKIFSYVLGRLDDKIALNRRINQTLEAMAQALFKSWFVDFDPVKAKIAAIQEGRDPLRAAMRAISGKPDAELDTLTPEPYAQLAATAALFPDAMEESELGEIPRGWEVNQISQFGNVVCGKTPSKANPEYFGVGIPFIKIPDMHSSVYVINPSEQLAALGAASQAKKTIPAGSICVSCIATIGKVVITHEPSQTNQQINSIVPNFAEYTVYLYFQMSEKEKEFHDLASGGSATLNMNTSTFSKVNVLMPGFGILAKFSSFVAPLFSEILSRQKESAFLSETRDTLLPKLLSGELSVAGAEPLTDTTPLQEVTQRTRSQP